MGRYNVKFEYEDAMSGFQTREQECTVSANNPVEARKKCIDWYGLGIDCDYKITDVIDLEDKDLDR